MTHPLWQINNVGEDGRPAAATLWRFPTGVASTEKAKQYQRTAVEWFTDEDVALLAQAADELERPILKPPHSDYWEYGGNGTERLAAAKARVARFRALADRIAALLPPEAP